MELSGLVAFGLQAWEQGEDKRRRAYDYEVRYRRIRFVYFICLNSYRHDEVHDTVTVEGMRDRRRASY